MGMGCFDGKFCHWRNGYLCFVLLSSDASRFVSVSQEGYQRVWTVPTSKGLIGIRDAMQVTSVVFPKNSAHILFGARNGSVHLWDVSASKEQ